MLFRSGQRSGACVTEVLTTNAAIGGSERGNGPTNERFRSQCATQKDSRGSDPGFQRMFVYLNGGDGLPFCHGIDFYPDRREPFSTNESHGTRTKVLAYLGLLSCLPFLPVLLRPLPLSNTRLWSSKASRVSELEVFLYLRACLP